MFNLSIYQYYCSRAKLRTINREDDLELINRKALQIARAVADDTNTLMAGNICVTGVYNSDDSSTFDVTRTMFEVTETYLLANILWGSYSLIT